VIPPLCLLLAAQASAVLSASAFKERRLRQPSISNSPQDESTVADLTAGKPSLFGQREHITYAIALVFALLVTGSYTTWKMVTGYRDHRDALVIFGRDVRREAEGRHWRYEVVSAKDEGLLLYLQKMHYMEPDRAVAEWNSGNLDALVVSTGKAPGLMTRLRGATVSQLKSTRKRKEQGTGYVLIVH
jgi:hypothetical protein